VIVQGEKRLSLVDRILRLVTEVRAGEGGTAILLALNIFLVLAAYSVIKPVREALIGEGAGPTVKAYMYAAVVVLLALVVPLYGRVASRMPRRRLINLVTAFFAANLVLFYIVFRPQVGIPLFAQGVVFFLWISVFNVMVIAQFYAFANDIYTTEEGERLFPVVVFGASFGAVVGSLMSRGVIPTFGVYPPLIVAAALLIVSLFVTNYVDSRERRLKEADLPDALTTGAVPAASQEIPLADIRAALSGEIPVEDVQRTLTGEISFEEIRRALEADEAPGEAEADVRAKLDATAREVDLAGTESPFKMVFSCPYLLMIGLLVMLLNWVNSGGEIILTDVVVTAAKRAVETGAAGGQTEGQVIGTWWAGFFSAVNIVGLFLQLFIVSRVIKYLGVSKALLILPLISLGTYSLIAFYPVLRYIQWAKVAENSTDYSLYNTTRQMLFLPCTREQKYKAKQVIDSFFHRAGDVLVSVTFFIGTTLFAMQPKGFAPLNIGLALIWLVLAALIGREYKRLTDSGRPPCVG
jgi:AAA family ATP:ADP antiporter